MPLRPPAGYIRPGYNPLQVANAPTVGTASAGDTTASVAFTAPSNVGGGAISLYYAVSSPGQITATSVTSPVTVTGLTNGTSYTFTVWAANPFGPSPYSASSNSVTPSPPYIEDVFSTYLYTGNGSTQTITNGIDLSGKGGLVWVKSRSNAQYHALNDTARGAGNVLQSQSTDANINQGVDGLSAFTSSGFSVGMDGAYNNGTWTYASWTFREQAKFFDVVTYTGNGTTQNIAHSLGSTPGCIIVKSTNNTFSWGVYHRSYPNGYLFLNSTNAGDTANAQNMWGNNSTVVAPTSTQFTVGSFGTVNSSGTTYVAYLFAHDAGGFGLTGTDNVISCGSFTGTGSTVTVNLGYEPQWLMFKRTDDIGDWVIIDNMRGWTTAGADAYLRPNTSGAEASITGGPALNATGFSWTSAAGSNFIYIAIRRGPMKTPTTGTSVFAPVAQSTSGSYPRPVVTNFPVDFVIMGDRSTAWGFNWSVQDRLRGNPNVLFTSATSSENTGALSSFASNTQFGDGWVTGGTNGIYECFRRAPGFFDVVCYTGTGSATTQAHNLGVVPELMILKPRSNGSNGWCVYSATVGNTGRLLLDTSDAAITGYSVFWNSTTPTSTVFSLGTAALTNQSATTFVAYLFASCPGVSKVGSYTGTGNTLQVDCGFTGGARFVLIKRTDSTGDWYVWDSARGIVAGNDPYLLLNSTAAEVTNTDYVDTYSAGFEISSTAPAAINANGGSYIFLAIA